jgi:competence protein ComEA
MKIFKNAIVAALLVLPFATGAATAAEPAADGAGARVVNVNKATSEQLTLLPRIGPAIAERILEYRKANGDFKRPEDLMMVQGIGEKLFEQLKPYVRISGETTLKEKLKAAKKSPEAATAKSEGASPASPEPGT